MISTISIFLSNHTLLPQVELLATALTRGVAAELLAIALTRARSDTLATALTEADPKLLTVALTQVTQHCTAEDVECVEVIMSTLPSPE